jgi:ATP-dependent DNA ligase
MAVDETGVFIPRRELAEFRSPKAGDDARVRLEIFDILYHPESKNVVMLPLFERKKLLHGFLSGLKSPLLSIMPDKLVHTEVELKSAIEWARKLGGSEGAMFKLRDMTVTLRETDSMAKLKAIREISGMVWDKHPVKDSPGVYNFFYAVGPVSQKESTHYAEPVELLERFT